MGVVLTTLGVVGDPADVFPPGVMLVPNLYPEGIDGTLLAPFPVLELPTPNPFAFAAAILGGVGDADLNPASAILVSADVPVAALGAETPPATEAMASGLAFSLGGKG